MRRLTYLLFVALLCLVSLLACRKDLEGDKPTKAQNHGQLKGATNSCYKGLNIACGMLSFTDQDQFNQVYDCLNSAYEANLDNFETQYGNLSEDAYNDMADQIGFVDEQPLIDFETGLAFYSYRTQMAALEDAWLLNGADDNSCPLFNDIFEDDVMATLFNKDGAIMIGGVIEYYAQNGTIIEIQNGDCALYNCIASGSLNCDTTQVRIHKSSTTPCGVDFADRDSTVYFDNNNRKVMWHMRFQHTGGYNAQHKFISQIWSYKKKNGHWKKRRIQLAENLHGTAYDSADGANCKSTACETLQPPKRRRTRSHHQGFWPQYDQFSIKNKSLWATHYFNGNMVTAYFYAP